MDAFRPGPISSCFKWFTCFCYEKFNIFLQELFFNKCWYNVLILCKLSYKNKKNRKSIIFYRNNKTSSSGYWCSFVDRCPFVLVASLLWVESCSSYYAFLAFLVLLFLVLILSIGLHLVRTGCCIRRSFPWWWCCCGRLCKCTCLWVSLLFPWYFQCCVFYTFR